MFLYVFDLKSIFQ